MLRQKVRESTGKKEWCLVSESKPGKVLEWYGQEKPSTERVAQSEQRVQYYKHR
jgi:hypothetical protein